MRLAFKMVLVFSALVLCCGAFAQTRAPKRQPRIATAPPPQNDCLGYAQHPDLRPESGDQRPQPTVTFRLEMPKFNPKYFGVAVESSGRAAYVSEPLPPPEGTPGDPFIWKFTITDAVRQRIFDLAQAANYFQGDFDAHKANIANTGSKTLSFADGTRCNQTTFNYSDNPSIMELARIFQDISTTLEYGQRLQFEHRFDKLGLDAELKSMEESAKRNELLEVQAIEPILTSIASDYGVMNLARGRAERLLAKAKGK